MEKYLARAQQGEGQMVCCFMRHKDHDCEHVLQSSYLFARGRIPLLCLYGLPFALWYPSDNR
jgi:hypothetical protein